ncbi:MAG TPA: hypothetical protein VK595_00915, partial [Vicinamibacterales bacterium]|nr:hypothetical protein [Vicinamibacterales bacterium]
MHRLREAAVMELPELRQALKTDYPFYARTVLKVADRQSVVAFDLRPAQLELWSVLRAQRDAGKPMRAVILKARKLGFSTFAQGLLLQRTTLSPLHRAIIVAHNATTAGAIVEMAELMYRHLPDVSDPELMLKPPIANRRRHKEIRFGTPDRFVRWNEGEFGFAQSSLLIDTAREFEAGRGHTFQSVHGSEVAFWPALKRKLTSLLNAVPSDDPDTLVMLESTANGHNEFKEFWERAQAGDSDFAPYFAGWHRDVRYRRPLTARQRESFQIGSGEWGSDEAELAAQFDLDLEQLHWRRWAIENLCQSDLNVFRQEYPSFPEEAFMATGQTVFGGVLIQKAIRAAAEHPEPQPTKLEATSKTERRTRRGVIEVPNAVKAIDGGPWEIFVAPADGRQYVIACDPASGEDVHDGAAFAVQVIDHETRQQCAQLEIRTEPDLVSEQLMLACLYYCKSRRPWLAIERTGGYGLALIDTLFHEYGYKQLYTRRRADAPTGNYADRLGWDTTKSTKGLLHEEAMTLLREGSHGIRSLRLARQMETYVRRGTGRTGPIHGQRSDLLLAWMIAQTVASEKPPRKKREGPPKQIT